MAAEATRLAGQVGRQLASAQQPPFSSGGGAGEGRGKSCAQLRVCLVHFVKLCKDVNKAFEVLNEVYLHRWIVNRETNLMMLINL